MKIDKNIPIPDQTQNRKKYPWNDMGVGDSLLIDLDQYTKNIHSSILSAATSWAKRHDNGCKFRTRREGDNGLRIWRIK